MGFGDEIMAAGQAQRVYELNPNARVAICDCNGSARWHELWHGNPAIAHPDDVLAGEAVQRIYNAPGCRPYIKYPFTPETGLTFTDYRANDHWPRVYLTDAELERSERLRRRIGDFIVIEPSHKAGGNPNKRWPLERWAAVIAGYPWVPFVQMLHADSHQLPGTIGEVTAGFRDACAVLQAATAYVGIEGGLHHACAAVGRPAVVLFGGYVSPQTTGYGSHINLADQGPGSPCGRWSPCEHCRCAMDRIAVDDVLEAIDNLGSGAIGSVCVEHTHERHSAPANRR